MRQRQLTKNDIKALFPVQALSMLNNLTNISQLWKDATEQEGTKYYTYDFEVYLPLFESNLQRPLIWSEFQKSELICSILYERYIPPITVVEFSKEGSFDRNIIQVIDGKQRMNAMIEFRDGKFPVEVNGEKYFYNQLDVHCARLIDRYSILAKQYVSCGTDKSDKHFICDDAKLEIFERVNYSGTQQSDDHISNIIRNRIKND
jgi:hypothetical protein